MPAGDAFVKQLEYVCLLIPVSIVPARLSEELETVVTAIAVLLDLLVGRAFVVRAGLVMSGAASSACVAVRYVMMPGRLDVELEHLVQAVASGFSWMVTVAMIASSTVARFPFGLEAGSVSFSAIDLTAGPVISAALIVAFVASAALSASVLTVALSAFAVAVLQVIVEIPSAVALLMVVRDGPLLIADGTVKISSAVWNVAA